MALPVAAFVLNDEKKVYTSTRLSGLAGAGIWSTPTVIFNAPISTWPSVITQDLTAGALDAGDNYGLITNTSGLPIFLGNGSPQTPVALATGLSGAFPNFYGTSMGAATHGSAMFAVIQDEGASAGTPTVIKSVNGGATWGQVDAIHQPTGVWVSFGMIQRVDNYFYLLLSITGGTSWRIYPFNMATSLWEPSFAPLTATIAVDLFNIYTNGIYKFPNGDFGIIYNNASNLPVYRRWVLATTTWGSPVSLTGQNYGSSVMGPDLETIYGWNYHLNTGEVETTQVDFYKITHLGVLTSISTIPPPAFTASGDGVQHPAILNGLILIGRDDTADNSNSVWVADINVGTFFKESLPIPAGEEGGFPTCVYMVFPNGYLLSAPSNVLDIKAGC